MIMVSLTSTINGALPFCPARHYCSSSSLPPTTFKNRGWQENENLLLVKRRTRVQPFRVFANPKASSGKRNPSEVIMVDPLEAKRLAAKELEVLRAKEKMQKRRQIEAVNGAWAMIGLTAGLVIEGQTGNGFLAQLVGYWKALVGLIFQ